MTNLQTETSATIVKPQEDVVHRYLRLAAAQGTSPLHKAAYAQLVRLDSGDFSNLIYDNTYDVPPERPESEHALAILYKMGFDVLPVVAEALSDHRPTETRCKANVLAAYLIVRLAERTFPAGETTIERVGLYPYWEEWAKESVLEWYEQNHNRTLAERKVLDIECLWNDGNRYAAIKWVGDHREESAVGPLTKRINEIFASKHGQSDGTAFAGPGWEGEVRELSRCAWALGQIGDRRAVPVVRRVCKYFYDEFSAEGERMRRSSPDRPLPGLTVYKMCEGHIRQLFESHKAWAMLGAKDEALRNIEYLDAMLRTAKWNAADRREFDDGVRASRDW